MQVYEFLNKSNGFIQCAKAAELEWIWSRTRNHFPSRGSVDASRCSLTLARVKQRLNFPAVVNVNKGNNKLSADAVASLRKKIFWRENKEFSL